VSTADIPERDILEGVPESGELVLEKYRIERMIGQGAMGVVMEARFVQLDERVAIKFLLPALGANEEAISRFQREAKVLFKIKSEHVCRVLDVGQLPNGVPFIVMEYLEGHDLANELFGKRGLPIELALHFMMDACLGLGEAHARGIVHRDLKPENLFLGEAHGEPCIKVLDFGLSKFSRVSVEGRRERKLTAQQQVMGTPQYMAPEQWLSSASVGPAADQWALGAILFEMCTGAPPFDAEDIGRICTLTLKAPTPKLSAQCRDAPAGLDAIIERVLAKQPIDRYPHVGALAVALAPFCAAGALEAAERLSTRLDNAPPHDAPMRLPLAATPPSLPSRVRTTLRMARESSLRLFAENRIARWSLIVSLATLVGVGLVWLTRNNGPVASPRPDTVSTPANTTTPRAPSAPATPSAEEPPPPPEEEPAPTARSKSKPPRAAQIPTVAPSAAPSTARSASIFDDR
jgi:serine/threonine-protein kinase